jgi:NADH-quinone oxidoreductase subunit N
VSETFYIILPQSLLGIAACLFLLAGTFSIPARRFGPAALVALMAAAGALYYSSHVPLAQGVAQELAQGPASAAQFPVQQAVLQTSLGWGIQWCCLVAGALFVLQSMGAQARSETAGEFYGLFLMAIAGLMLVPAVNELILLFLALELISVPTYVLLYLGRRDQRSQEATIKYFLLSIVSAALLLYGFAFLYGLTGSTHLGAIREILAANYRLAGAGVPAAGGSLLGIIALVLIVAGLGFKIAAVPFHFYAPDVYEGTSAFNAGFLAIAPKAAGILAMVRVLVETMAGYESTAQQLLLVLAIITMTGGNCLALWQTNVRRLLAYSSVAHAGYMLIGLSAGLWQSWNSHIGTGIETAATVGGLGLSDGLRGSLLYLLAYSLASAGLFSVLVYLGRPGKQVDHIDELTGLGRTHPLAAFLAALFLFSLAGIPPLPGFWAKLSVFTAALSIEQTGGAARIAIHPAFLMLAVVGVINAAVGAVYYLRMIATMYLSDPISTARPEGGRPALAAALGAGVLTLCFGLAPGPVFTYLQQNAPSTSSAHALVEVERVKQAGAVFTKASSGAR